MKVIVTLDYWNGRSRIRDCDSEALPRFLSLWLAERGVASISITRRDSLKKIALHTEGWNK